MGRSCHPSRDSAAAPPLPEGPAGRRVGRNLRLSPATADAAAERYGIRAWFTDHQAMLEKARPDVIHVALDLPPFPAGEAAFEELNRWPGTPSTWAVILSTTMTAPPPCGPRNKLRRLGRRLEFFGVFLMAG